MSTHKPAQRVNFGRHARNWGLTALAAATIGGYSLYSRSVNASHVVALAPLQPVAAMSLTPTVPGATEARYQDGEYRGASIRASHWGNVAVSAIIENGQLVNFTVQDYPHSRSTSDHISRIVIPRLMEEAVQAQSATIDLISGATPTSIAFVESLQSALDAASLMVTPTSSSGSML
jgi:uncharacterized protein with FMN-binding domain